MTAIDPATGNEIVRPNSSSTCSTPARLLIFRCAIVRPHSSGTGVLGAEMDCAADAPRALCAIP